jgi:signal transduction histidine kinase
MTKTLLNTNELQLDQVLSVIPSGLFLVDLNMRIIYWNHAAERITGFSAKDAVGQHCSFLQGIPCGRGCGLLNPDIPKPIIGIPCSVVNKSGERISLLKNVEYLRDDQGLVIGGIESFVDISHQRQLERDLRQQTLKLDRRVQERTADLAHSEARFRSVLDNMNDLAYIASPDFHITFMNRAMRDLFGEQVGEPCHKVLHKLNKICPWCPMANILDNKTVRDERPFCSSRSTYEIIHTPLVSDDGQIQKLAVCRDITGRKQTEDELREANRELDAFAHSISHDLRGLLAPVVTYMDFLKEQYGDVLDSEIIKVMADVERQSERAITLLDDLLDLAQVGRITPAEQLTDVSLIVDEVLAEHRDPKGRQPTITKQPLPKTWLPEALVYQIFTNLIGNAFNYAANATEPAEVGCREDDNWLVYFVRDHGPGVHPDESESIFDIFFRGVAGREIRGTGVGLAIIRKIALRCGGTCWVEDTPGGGATFCIAIPKDPAPHPAVDNSP